MSQWEYDLQYASDSPIYRGKVELCEDCERPVDDCECYSPCCGAKMSGGNGDSSFSDYGICPECGEHI